MYWHVLFKSSFRTYVQFVSLFIFILSFLGLLFNDDDDATSKPEAVTQIPIYPSQGHYTENKIAIRKFITAFKENAYSKLNTVTGVPYN